MLVPLNTMLRTLFTVVSFAHSTNQKVDQNETMTSWFRTREYGSDRPEFTRMLAPPSVARLLGLLDKPLEPNQRQLACVRYQNIGGAQVVAFGQPVRDGDGFHAGGLGGRNPRAGVLDR